MLNRNDIGEGLTYLGREILRQNELGHERPHHGVAVRPCCVYLAIYKCVEVGGGYGYGCGSGYGGMDDGLERAWC